MTVKEREKDQGIIKMHFGPSHDSLSLSVRILLALPDFFGVIQAVSRRRKRERVKKSGHAMLGKGDEAIVCVYVHS